MPKPVDPADIERFLRLATGEEPFPQTEFLSQRLDLFRAVLSALADGPADATRDDTACERLVATLVFGNRFFDLASLHAFLKKSPRPEEGGHDIYPAFRAALLRRIRDLFIATLTYHSPELDFLFCETLGEDRQQFLELLGHLFEQQRLYSLRISPNMQKVLYGIADENVRHFVQFSNIHFLAFYLAALRTAAPIAPAHLDKWVSLLLSPTTAPAMIDKILGALKIHPTVEFLLPLILLSRDEQRSVVLSLLRTILERRPYLLRDHIPALACFLGRAAASHFYDFHRIPQEQKVLISNLMLFCDDASLTERAVAMMTENNPHNDAKRIETKKIFVVLLARLGERDQRHIRTLRTLLNHPSVEHGARQEILRILRDLPGRFEVMADADAPVPPPPPPPSPPLDDPDREENTLISPLFGGAPATLDDDEKTVVDKRPK